MGPAAAEALTESQYGRVDALLGRVAVMERRLRVTSLHSQPCVVAGLSSRYEAQAVVPAGGSGALLSRAATRSALTRLECGFA